MAIYDKLDVSGAKPLDQRPGLRKAIIAARNRGPLTEAGHDVVAHGQFPATIAGSSGTA